jgi:hypothetical protein
LANIIHARSKGEGEFMPSSKTLCFLCMEHGDRFVFIRGRRKYACARHYREWEEAAKRMGDKLLSSEEA